jgi:hypothetical protein
MRQRSRIVPVLVVALVLLAGCSGFGGGDGGDGGDGGALQASGGVDGGAGGTSASDGGDGSAGASAGGSDDTAATVRQLATDRAIVRTGSVTVEVDDFETQRERLTGEVERLSGYVGGSTSDLHRRANETWRTGSLTLRVPAESFDRLLSYAKDRGEVLSAETSTKDVTDQLVELDARITTLEAKRSRLRAFYRNASSTDALLRIEDRLSEVQGDVERLEARKRSLEDRVSYSTLDVELREPAPDDEGTVADDASRAGIVGTLRNSASTLLDVGYAGLLLVVGLLPWGLALGVLAVAWLTVRRVLALPSLRAVLPGGTSASATGGGTEPRAVRERERHPRTRGRRDDSQATEALEPGETRPDVEGADDDETDPGA